jgi:ATP adenylyltransferase
MEHLWAPWRNSYVTQKQPPDADIFLKIGQSSDDEAHFVLARSKSCFAVLNAFPYNGGHLMVIPYRKVARLEELSGDELLDIFDLLKRMKTAIDDAMHPHGFNIGLNIGAAAGAGIVQHLHFHLVPRWNNDANFMTATADTRVHPSDLPAIYKQIRDNLPPS